MIETLTRAEEIRNDIDNLYFSIRYYIGVLAELEELGKQGTEEFNRIQKGVNTLKANVRHLQKELENEEL